jgi:hypothetical protein
MTARKKRQGETTAGRGVTVPDSRGDLLRTGLSTYNVH